MIGRKEGVNLAGGKRTAVLNSSIYIWAGYGEPWQWRGMPTERKETKFSSLFFFCLPGEKPPDHTTWPIPQTNLGETDMALDGFSAPFVSPFPETEKRTRCSNSSTRTLMTARSLFFFCNSPAASLEVSRDREVI